MAGYSNQLSRALRDQFPTLTVKRIEELRAAMIAMPRGVVVTPVTEFDLKCPYELVVLLHLARDLAHCDREELGKIVRKLSARGKRRRFPKSYEEENAAPTRYAQ